MDRFLRSARTSLPSCVVTVIVLGLAADILEATPVAVDSDQDWSVARVIDHQRGRKPNGEQKIAERSSLLPGAADGNGAPWSVHAMQIAPGCPTPQPETRLRVTPSPRMPLPASSIDLDGCRRRYLYQYVYQLYDDQAPFLRMHQAIRETVKQLAERARSDTLPTDEDSVRTLLYGQLQRYELDDVLYADDYAAETWRHVRSVWDDMRSARLVPGDVDTRVTIRRPAGTIKVRVDRIDRAGEQPRWVWTRSGMPGDDDHLNERVMLYALAHQTQHGGEGEIAIHYTATGEVRQATPNAKVLANHTAKIDALLAAMQAGQWDPTL